MLKNWLLVLLVLIFSAFAATSQNAGVDFKTKGIGFLRANQSDSALIYLDLAMGAGISDGEVLGAVAVLYMERGDIGKAMQYARKARKQAETVTPDAFIAGVLASEKDSKPKRRNRWLNEGIKKFPEDYLLLYHAGRLKIPFNKKEGEEYLLRSVYAAPWFAESHYMLGQQMFRHGENLKAVLPLFYFLLLENSSERSMETVLVLERIYQAWAVSDKGISKITRVSPGFKTAFTPESGDFKPTDYTARSKWLVQQTVALMTALDKVEVSSSDILWEFYSDFFHKAVELGHAEALAWHLVNARYPADLLEWVAGNGSSYKEMVDWLSIQ